MSNDLKYDAERDLKDIEAPNIPVFALNKVLCICEFNSACILYMMS